MIRSTTRHAAALLFSFTLCALAQAAEKRPLQPLDIFDMQWVTDPQISPDASQVVYVRNKFDVMKDRAARQIWIVDSNGTNHEPLSAGTHQSRSPRWSPEGDRLAYISGASGKSQLHIRWMTSGREAAISQLQHSPSAPTWSPDGQYLAFTQFVEAKREPIATLPAKPEGAKWNDAPKVYEDLIYRRDGRGYNRGGYTQIFVISASGGKPVQLTTHPYPHSGSLSWSADSQTIYFSANYADKWQQDQSERDLFQVSVTTGEIQRITTRDGRDTNPAASPDGKWLVYLGSDDVGGYQDVKAYITDPNDHNPRKLIDIDRPITAIRWSANSRNLYFTYTDEGKVKLARSNLTGKYEVVAEGLGGSAIGRPYAGSSFSVARNGTLAHDVSMPRQPASLAVTRRGESTVLFDLNRDWLAGLDLNAPEEIWYESSHDGQRIQGWIVKPPGFDPEKKYPLVLEIHGGPHSAYGDFFSAEVQLYAAAGYVVLYTNPRGSISYGEKFAREIFQDYPGHDYDDLISGVDAVINKGYIDPDNLFVTGGSGGGILTAWVVTKTDRFAAAVSQKPVINWYSMTLVSDIGSQFWKSWFSAPPWEDGEAYLDKSPMHFAHKVTTPTMLLTGEEDWRTPMSESEQFYLALKMNDVPSALVRIPNTSHSIAAKPSGLIAKAAYVVGWFERYRTRAE